MLRIAWKRAKKALEARKLSQAGECFVTIYSKKLPVVDHVVDHYLSDSQSFRKLHAQRVCGTHQLFVSQSLAEATERLIQLRKAGRISDADGSACHLIASVNVHFMAQLLRKSKDFRPYLRELSVSNFQRDTKKVVNL